jgi:diguanylate cyclase (GGDEF)-like protein
MKNIDIDTKARFAIYVDGSGARGSGPMGFRWWLEDEIYAPVCVALENVVPSSLARLRMDCENLWRRLEDRHENAFSDAELALVRRAAIHYRAEVVRQISRLQRVNSAYQHAQVIDGLADEVTADLEGPFLGPIKEYPKPSLIDYVNLQRARKILSEKSRGIFPERSYDDKFGILWAASALQGVLRATRVESELLRTSVVVGFIDIDDFKSVNTELSETVVDRSVLPQFMTILEATTSQRGYAFKQGGDEYIVVLPNLDGQEGRRLLEKICERIRSDRFGPNRDKRLTVSIGYTVADYDAPETEDQIISAANENKQIAKRLGKDRVHP